MRADASELRRRRHLELTALLASPTGLRALAPFAPVSNAVDRAGLLVAVLGLELPFIWAGADSRCVRCDVEWPDTDPSSACLRTVFPRAPLTLAVSALLTEATVPDEAEIAGAAVIVRAGVAAGGIRIAVVQLLRATGVDLRTGAVDGRVIGIAVAGVRVRASVDTCPVLATRRVSAVLNVRTSGAISGGWARAVDPLGQSPQAKPSSGAGTSVHSTPSAHGPVSATQGLMSSQPDPSRRPSPSNPDVQVQLKRPASSWLQVARA